ncbi:hypothetical protein QYZ87_05045 [Porphyromonadaceae bacterium W3.11]|nr:hypothetical protein [Porphyromonadaceae bacterium W3.11]MDN4753896.1 hypothetical protein [Porphyromonadaceae bacterium W3.11]
MNSIEERTVYNSRLRIMHERKKMKLSFAELRSVAMVTLIAVSFFEARKGLTQEEEGKFFNLVQLSQRLGQRLLSQKEKYTISMNYSEVATMAMVYRMVTGVMMGPYDRMVAYTVSEQLNIRE